MCHVILQAFVIIFTFDLAEQRECMSFKASLVSGRMFIQLEGACDYTFDTKLRDSLSKILTHTPHFILDFSNATKVDFVFCAFVYGLLEGLDSKNYELSGMSKEVEEIFHTLAQSLPESPPAHPALSLPRPTQILSAFGHFVVGFWREVLDFLNFCGLCLWHLARYAWKPRFLKLNSVLYHMNESGFKALPVALLTAFIVSYAIALQGVLQLEKMGVPIMSVEIVAKLALREMGPFILAIVIAGRSSSAFSAQLGVMNLTEESDALKTMNLSLFDYLVLPRVLALIIVMPLCVFLSDAISLLAAMIAIKVQTGINFVQYLERFYEYVDINNFWVGVVKAPFFGAAIALVGCFRGLYVRGDTESVGLETTKSVVNALFWVILINAIFSVITTRLNI